MLDQCARTDATQFTLMFIPFHTAFNFTKFFSAFLNHVFSYAVTPYSKCMLRFYVRDKGLFHVIFLSLSVTIPSSLPWPRLQMAWKKSKASFRRFRETNSDFWSVPWWISGRTSPTSSPFSLYYPQRSHLCWECIHSKYVLRFLSYREMKRAMRNKEREIGWKHL